MFLLDRRSTHLLFLGAGYERDQLARLIQLEYEYHQVDLLQAIVVCKRKIVLLLLGSSLILYFFIHFLLLIRL